MSGDPAADNRDSLSLKVPRTSGVAILYPGYIQNVENAVESLGGEKTLHTALQDAAGFLKLRLRPYDQHSHPLFGERQPENGLVLRISRPRGQPDAEPTVTVVSRVHASYAFNGMADYQFLGADSLEGKRDLSAFSDTRNDPAEAEPFRNQQPFLLVPPLFSKGDMPVAFAFRDQAPPKETEVEVNSQKRIISFYETYISPELTVDTKDYSSPELQAQLQKLKELFSSRPAWPLELLLEKIPGSTAASLTPALQALCYQFKTGPWKSLFLRCGFDPRASLDGRQYQMISYRLPQDWNKAVKAAKAAGRPMKSPPLSQLLRFAAMPVHHTTHLQLCDLSESDAAISQLLQQAPVPPTPSEAYGWFTYSSSQQLQQAMQLRFGVVMKLQLEKLGKQEQQQQQQQQGRQEEQAAGADKMDMEQEASATVEPDQQPQQQQEQQEEPSEADKPTAAVSPAPAPAPAEPPLEGLVGMLGLDSAQDELQEWLQEEAAAAEARQRRRAAAGVDSGGESTDAGLSEGDSDWGFTSGGETTGDEATDVDEYDGYNEDV